MSLTLKLFFPFIRFLRVLITKWNPSLAKIPPPINLSKIVFNSLETHGYKINYTSIVLKGRTEKHIGIKLQLKFYSI